MSKECSYLLADKCHHEGHCGYRDEDRNCSVPLHALLTYDEYLDAQYEYDSSTSSVKMTVKGEPKEGMSSLSTFTSTKIEDES